MTQSTLTDLSPGIITYTTAEISSLTIDTGPSGDQELNIDFSGGNPIPTASSLVPDAVIPDVPPPSSPGLIFNAGADAVATRTATS